MGVKFTPIENWALITGANNSITGANNYTSFPYGCKIYTHKKIAPKIALTSSF